MIVEALVPLKLNSQRLPNKNLLPLGDKPLFSWIVEAIIDSEAVDGISLFSSTRDFFDNLGYGDDRVSWVPRPKSLDGDETSITEVIRTFCLQSTAEIIVLAHATSPFIRPATIQECVAAVASGDFDSAFAAIKMQKFTWFHNQPVNYSLEGPLPRTQDLDPVFVEQSGLYVFGRQQFLDTNQRIGRKPKIVEVDSLESVDIDEPQDLELAEILVNRTLSTPRS
ncbi:MAG: acylneuraminate cytidylyltransferase family protein [Actinomycetales bacterium]|nr:acylneuraminate cytidylyltransferase family protein [Actinomycetales bacterium]